MGRTQKSTRRKKRKGGKPGRLGCAEACSWKGVCDLLLKCGRRLTKPADEFLAEMLGSQSIGSKAKRRRTDGESSPRLEVSRLGDDEAPDEEGQVNGHAGPSRKNVDDLLPIGVGVSPFHGSSRPDRPAVTCSATAKKVAEGSSEERMGSRGRCRPKVDEREFRQQLARKVLMSVS